MLVGIFTWLSISINFFIELNQIWNFAANFFVFIYHDMEQCGQVKEPYMETLKSVILDQEHITAVKRVSFVFVYGVSSV